MRPPKGWLVPTLLAAAALARAEGSTAQDLGRLHVNHAQAAEVLANGEVTVELLVATRLGRAAQVIDRIEHLGGHITVRVDAVGYIRAELPIGDVAPLAASVDVD